MASTVGHRLGFGKPKAIHLTGKTSLPGAFSPILGKLEPWFARTIEQNDLYDVLETVYRTDDPEVFVRYRRRIVHNQESFMQTVARLFRLGASMLNDGVQTMTVLSLFVGATSLFSVVETSLTTGGVDDVVVPALFFTVFFTVVFPLSLVLFERSEYQADNKPDKKELEVHDRSGLKEFLSDVPQETLPDSLGPRTLEAPES